MMAICVICSYMYYINYCILIEASDDTLKHHMIQCKLLGKLYNKLKIWRSKSQTDTTLIQVIHYVCVCVCLCVCVYGV